MDVAKTIDLANRVLAYREYGDPEGSPLLYFHGYPSSSLEASFLDGAARDRGLRIIAPDRPGYGDSSMSPNLRIIDWPRDMAALTKHLGIDRFGVLAKGLGTPYALACGNTMATRITGIGIAGGVVPAKRATIATALAWSKLFTLPMLGSKLRNPERAERAWASFYADSGPNEEAASKNPEWRRARLAGMDNAFVEGSGGAAKDWAIAMGANWGFALGNIHVENIVIWHGDADVKTPIADIRRMADRLPSADVRVLADEGHNSAFVNHRDEILDAMKGLAG